MLKKLYIFFLAVIGISVAAGALEDKLEKSSFVTIGQGEHKLDRTVVVNHDLTVVLENGAVLKSSCDPMFMVKGGEIRINGVGKPGKIISLAQGMRGWKNPKRGAAFNLNHVENKLPLKFFLNNLYIEAYNGVDGYLMCKDKRDIAEINISDCRFKCVEKAIATHSVTLGTAKVENCDFDGGDNPIFLNSPAPGGMIIRGNTLRNFGRTGIQIGKSGQVAEGCTTHLPDTIVHDNRLIGGGRGATIDDSYIQGILIYGNNVSVQGNIVRDVNRGEPVPGERIGQQIKTPDGQILRGKSIMVNGKRRRLAGAAIYLKANRAIVQGNICTNSGWRSVIEIKTGGKEYFTSVMNNVVDGRALAIDESFGFECHAGRSVWAGNLVYDMPHQAFVVRSGYENSFINNVIVSSKTGFALSGLTPGEKELIAGNRFIDVANPVAVDGKAQEDAAGTDILLPSAARIADNAELPVPNAEWFGRQIVRKDAVYLCVRSGNEYRWMELKGKILAVKKWKTSAKELVENSDFSNKELFAGSKNNNPKHPGWQLTCQSVREQQIPEEERGLMLDDKVFKTGTCSQKVVFPNTAAVWSLSRNIKLAPGRRYRAELVYKAEEPRNIRFGVALAGGKVVQERGAETGNWQTLTVDFVMPQKSTGCRILISGSKTTAGKAAWLDSVSIKELIEDVKVDGKNQLTSKNSWAISPKGVPMTRLENGSLEIVPENANNMILSSRVKLAPGAKWRFSAEMSVKGACSVVLADGKKIQAQEFVDFTTPAKDGFTTLRIWLPGQKAGSKVVVSNMKLQKIEE